MDLIDMELDAMIVKTGKGGRGKGQGTKGTKGKGKERKPKGWGKSKADGAGKGPKREKSEKKAQSNESKLDMSLEEVVEADKGSGKGKGSKEPKGKGKGKKVMKLWGGATSARTKGGSKGGKSRGDEGYGKSSWKGSSKGKGGDRWGSGGAYVPKGKGKGKNKGYDDDGPRSNPAWSQHDDWRGVEEDNDWGSGMRSSAGRRPPLRPMMGVRNAMRGASPERSWAGRLNSGGAWRRVEQDHDDSPPRAPHRRAALGVVQQAASRAARDQGVDRDRPAARPARAVERVREERAPVRQRASAREEAEPRRRAVREEEPTRRRPREEAAPAPVATKRRREAEAPAQTSSRPKRVKVTNVARDLDDQDIKEAFEAETGRIVKCTLDRSTAYITFANASDAVKAVETFDRGELNGKTITVVLDA